MAGRDHRHPAKTWRQVFRRALSDRVSARAPLDIDVRLLLPPIEAALRPIGKEREVVRMTGRSGTDRRNAGRAVLEPDQKVGLLLKIDRDLDAAVFLRRARLGRTPSPAPPRQVRDR